jgi:hypothetical protein
MPVTEMVVTIALTAAIVLVLIAVLRLIGTLITHKTIRRVVEVDPTHIDAVLAQIATPQDNGGDDRVGVVLIAIGLAMAGASFTAGATGGWTDYGLGGSLFPLLTGLALCVRQFVVARTRRRASGE